MFQFEDVSFPKFDMKPLEPMWSIILNVSLKSGMDRNLEAYTLYIVFNAKYNTISNIL